MSHSCLPCLDYPLIWFLVLEELGKLIIQISDWIIDIVLGSSLLTVNRFRPSSYVFMINFEQVNVCWDDNDDDDDNNNDDNSHDEDVNKTNLCLLFFISPNDSTSKTMKNTFLFHLKSSFCSRNIQSVLHFLPPLFFFLPAIALEDYLRYILKFMTSSIV